MGGAIDELGRRLSATWSRLRDAVIDPLPDPALADDIAASARAEAPIVWLIGKVGAGKSSIVRTLTGSSEAEIGEGFKPCTRASRVYDFPPEAPVVRFLDTRGLGEAAYDPAEDIAVAESRSHLVLAVIRVLDPVQRPLVEALSQIRARHPDWPLIVALTCLHEAYPLGTGHPLPYPFAEDLSASDSLPPDFARSLRAQMAGLHQLPGSGAIRFVAIDFTLPADGFAPSDYGIDALWTAIGEAAPAGLEARLRASGRARDDALSARAHPQIMGHASAAAAADLLPAVGLVAVPAIQGKMLLRLAAMFGQDWDARRFAEFGGCLGAGVAVRYGVDLALRQLHKLIPWWGWTAGALSAAVTSFAATYALGKAACAYLTYVRRELPVDRRNVAEAYRAALAEAIAMARSRQWRTPHVDRSA